MACCLLANNSNHFPEVAGGRRQIQPRVISGCRVEARLTTQTLPILILREIDRELQSELIMYS
jgi:hypothetical protein